MSYLFGYVIPCKNELKLKEYKLFQAVYCGLCKTLGQSSSQLTRFGLNYDFTFLALLLMAIDKEEPELLQEGCIANPFKKKPVIKRNKHLEYAADLNVIFVFLKLLDNWHDEHSLKSILTMPVYYFPSRKKTEKYSNKYNFFKKSLLELTALESEGNDIIDKSADVFSRIMARIFTPDYISDERQLRILNLLGYDLGRWIYILDAYSDLEEDINNNNYNSILLQYKYRESEGLENFINRVKESIEFTLTYTLSNMTKSYQLLEIHRYNNILENIIYQGLYKVMKGKLGKGGKNLEKSVQSTGSE